MNKFFLIGCLAVSTLTISCAHSKKATASANTQNANEWFQQKQWLNGLNLQPHFSINAAELQRQYFANKHLWDATFNFLKTHDLPNLAVGKYPVVGDSVYVTVTESPLKDFGQTQWESHRKYIDLQYVAQGREKIGVAPVATSTVIEPYSAEKDVAHYKADGKFYVAEPGTFFLFFPQDAHRPNIKVDTDKDKKIVVKIMAAQ